MQAIAPVTVAQLLAAGQQPLMKVEIFTGGAWVNLNSLAGENYVETAGISLGGASMTPNPVMGNWNVQLFNEDSIFTPQHPTSAFKDYLQTERLVRISIGGTYGEIDYYWQRIQGYMDVPNFNLPEHRITTTGGDYMKRLRDTELRSPNNYWGSSQAYNSISSDGVWGAEIYAETDAMDTADDGTAPYDNVANWVATNCLFASFADAGSPSTFFVGRVTGQAGRPVSITNVNVGAAVAGQYYQIKFWHRIVGGTGLLGIRIFIIQASGNCFHQIYYPTDAWKEETIEFEALDTGAIQWTLKFPPVVCDLRLDDFSIKNYTPYWKRYYELPGASTGPYYVTLDSGAGAVPIWQGEGDEDWKYVADAEAGPDPPSHPAKIVYFNINKVVPNGVNNLVISYFTQQVPENVVADLIYFAGIIDPTTGSPYANRAAVLAVMQFDATGKTIDMTWFRAGTTCLNAIKKLCEFCDYRFYFRYDSVPFFKPKPAAGVAVFTFTSPSQIASANTYQARSEIKNRIVIKGLKVSDIPGKEETMPSDLTGEDADDGAGGSIELYGERTKTITNHLFQTQAGIDAMCTALLAEYKDPKWYTDLRIPFNPVPLELGDNIQWVERFSPTLPVTKTGIVRDIKIDNYTVTFKLELT